MVKKSRVKFAVISFWLHSSKREVFFSSLVCSLEVGSERERVKSARWIIQSAKTTDLITSCVFLSYTPCLERKRQSVLMDPLQSFPIPPESPLSCEVELNGCRKVPVRGTGPCLTSTLCFGAVVMFMYVHVWETEAGFPMDPGEKGEFSGEKGAWLKAVRATKGTKHCWEHASPFWGLL